MGILLNCPTRYGLVIAPIKDDRGIFHLPVEESELPGFLFEPERLSPLNDQIFGVIESKLEVSNPHRFFVIEQDFTQTMKLNSGEEVTCYLALHNGEKIQLKREYPVFMDVLRNFPKNANRMALFRSFQYFATGFNDSLGAVASDHLMVEPEEDSDS